MSSSLLCFPDIYLLCRPLILRGDLGHSYQRSIIKLLCQEWQRISFGKTPQIGENVQYPITSHSMFPSRWLTRR